MIIITSEYGRFGNTIHSISNAIQLAKILNHNIIKLPKFSCLTSFMNSHIIKIDNTKEQINSTIISRPCEYFFNFRFEVKNDFTFKDDVDFCKKYINPILRFKPKKIDKDLCIHIRSGDIFDERPHPLYLQPPLIYYKKIIQQTGAKNILIVTEKDRRNPCINGLLKLDNVNVEIQSKDFKTDVETLLGCENLVVGAGSFGKAIFRLSTNLKNIYFSDLYKFDYSGDDINLNIIYLPGYSHRNWKNTPEQRKKMLEYIIPDENTENTDKK